MRSLEIDIVSDAGSEFRGFGTRELYAEFSRGRSPVYATRSRAWCIQTSRVPDFAAFAESKGYLVTLVDRRPVNQLPPVQRDEVRDVLGTTGTHEPADGVLW